MATMSRTTSSRSTFLSSTGNSTVKESRPAWYGGCSPGRANTLGRSNSCRSVGDYKATGNAKTTTEGGAQRVEKAAVKKNPSPLRTVAPSAGKVFKPSSPRLRPASPRVTTSTVLKEDPKTDTTILASSKPKVTKAPVKNETPPPTRPKKPVSTLMTPTTKSRKPLATIGTPTNQGIKDRSQPVNETPTRKLKERPSLSGAGQDASKTKDKPQPFSAWAFSAGKTRRGSTPGRGTTPNRAPVKSMFLSPQASKKNVKKEPLRKSAENHGIWIGQVPSRKRAAEKREADGGMPPPAQPTNSPEIPKRGSRELSGEGARGYFGAGPMVAPEGCGGFVRDRRKCKPRGTLVVGDDGLNMDSDSSGFLETSIQMPLPSVASVEWMDRKDGSGLINSSSTSVPEYYSDMNHSHGASKASQDFVVDEFRPQVKQARIGRGDRKQVRQSRQIVDEFHHGKSSYDGYGDGFYHQLKQASSSAGERHNEVRQSGQSADGFYRSRSSQEVSGDGFYEQLKCARSIGGEAYRPVRQSRQSGEGFYQPIVRSSQVFLQQLRQSQLSNKEGMDQFNRQSTQFTTVTQPVQREGVMQSSLYSEGNTQKSRRESIMQNSLFSEGSVDNSLQRGKNEFPEPAGYADVTIDWRDGLPDSGASSAKQSPDEWKNEEFVAGSVSFGSSWVPPAQERRMSGGAKTWYAPDSTWYGFSPITPEFHRASQLPEGGSKLIDALVAGSVRRRIMTERSSLDGNPDLQNKSLTQSLQILNVTGSINKSLHSRSSHSRSSRGSQEAGSFSFATRRSYANIAELEAEQSPDTYMCETASPIEPLLNDDVICEGAIPLSNDETVVQTASPLHGDSTSREIPSPLPSDDIICQTASPINEVCSAPTPTIEGSNRSDTDNTDNRWDEGIDSEDGVEYASPVAGNYLSPVKPTSHCVSPNRSSIDMGCTDSSRGVRTSRRTSMSRTLEELMRHNLHI